MHSSIVFLVAAFAMPFPAAALNRQYALSSFTTVESTEGMPLSQNASTFFLGLSEQYAHYETSLVLIGAPKYVIVTVLSFLVACFSSRLGFKQPIKNEAWPVDEDPNYWMENNFSCCDDAYVCCCGVCCMSVRWAHTMNLAGVLTFWKAFLLISLALSLNILIPTTAPLIGIGSLLILFYFRQKLRAKFDTPLEGNTDYLLECCFVFFCPGCAVVQEAYAVESAYKLDLKEVKAGPKSKIPLEVAK